MAADPYRYFRSEAREIVERLGQGVLEVEKGPPSSEVVSSLFRLAHTLKGAARVVKHTAIAELAHEIEDMLAPLRESSRSLTRTGIDPILATLDRITAHIARLGAAEPEAAAPSAEMRTAAVPAELRTIRAEVSELDDLLDNLTEVTTRVSAIRRTAGVLERARHVAQLLAEHAASPRLRDATAAARAASRTAALADELRGSLAILERDFTRGVDDLARELRQVKGAAEQLRLFPTSAVFSALQRTARDAAEHQGVQIDFATRGGDVRLDAHMLNTLQPALVQLVRNAVVHGIEKPAERAARGKTANGSVTIVVAKKGRFASFSCADDGRGVDVAAVRRVAEQRGILRPGSQALSADAVFELLLKGGLTTARDVTQVSGRGVGLDVVRAAAERLRGTVSVRSEAGAGTRIEMTVPVSLSSVDALVLETDTATAAIPIAAVRSSMRISAHELTRASGALSLVHDGRIIPFAPLSHLLGATTTVDEHATWSAVVVESGSSAAAVGATRLVAAETMIVRPLPPATPPSAVLLGAAIDADGTPQLVLDPDEVVRVITSARVIGSAEAAERPAPILIIDDSMTTRMLEQSILESAGFDVELAASAEEALEMARRTRYSLFLVDVEMPGMDGFTFVERTRADATLHRVPAILVTSREAASDRLRGEQAGASAYIVKSEFDQAELLRIIRGLVR